MENSASSYWKRVDCGEVAVFGTYMNFVDKQLRIALGCQTHTVYTQYVNSIRINKILSACIKYFNLKLSILLLWPYCAYFITAPIFTLL